MIRKVDILRMVKNVYRHSRGLPPRRLIYPAREWGLGLCATALLLVGVSVASAYLYTTLNNIEETIQPANVATVRYQSTAVEQALDRYADRERAFAALQAAAPASIPSVTTSTATTSETAVPAASSTPETTPVATSTGNPTLSF